jgi:hypothetical protein
VELVVPVPDTVSAVLYVEFSNVKVIEAVAEKDVAVKVTPGNATGAVVGFTISVVVWVTVKAANAVKPASSVAVTVLAPTGSVGIMKVVPAVRAATVTSGPSLVAPMVTLAVVPPVAPNPKPVTVITVPVGPLVGDRFSRVMAIAKFTNLVKLLASVAFTVYVVVGSEGTVKVPLKPPEASVVKVPKVSTSNFNVTTVPAIAVKLTPTTVIVVPGCPEVGVNVIPVVPVTLKLPVPDVDPEIVPSLAVTV